MNRFLFAGVGQALGSSGGAFTEIDILILLKNHTSVDQHRVESTLKQIGALDVVLIYLKFKILRYQDLAVNYDRLC